MGQRAILLTPQYLSRATMRLLPINLRVRWYEQINGHTERATLMGFERWLCIRVDTLFNPLEDFICEEWNEKQTCTKPKSNLKPHSLATPAKPHRAVQIQSILMNRSALFVQTDSVLLFVLLSSPKP